MLLLASYWSPIDISLLQILLTPGMMAPWITFHYWAVETLIGPVSLSQNLLLTPLCVETLQEAEVIENLPNCQWVLWDPKLKLRGLFGGHFNIRGITKKINQLTHLLSDSNLDCLTLCLTEKWLKQTTLVNVFTESGYQRFRRDRPDGRGGGVLFYVRDKIKCEHVVYNAGNMLEYVGIKIMLSNKCPLTS